MHYFFETRQLGISDTGLHLLRNKFNYESIQFQDVRQAEIRTAMEIKNWPIVLAIGIIIEIFMIYYVLRLIGVIGNHEVPIIDIVEIAFPVIPAMIGAYCIYTATRKATILAVFAGNGKRYWLSVRNLENDKSEEALTLFLKEKLQGRLTIHK